MVLIPLFATCTHWKLKPGFKQQGGGVTTQKHSSGWTFLRHTNLNIQIKLVKKEYCIFTLTIQRSKQDWDESEQTETETHLTGASVHRPQIFSEFFSYNKIHVEVLESGDSADLHGPCGGVMGDVFGGSQETHDLPESKINI